jgi:TDG/mug DNA glycosylase family protein
MHPVGFSRSELEAARSRVVDDLLGPDLRLLFVGINPGLWTAAANAHFARPGNRFWPALHGAGITAHVVDASAGMPPADAEELAQRGVGITNLVARATARADEVSAEELRAGGRRLEDLVVRRRPAVVAVLGVTAYRTAFDRRRAVAGRQPDRLAGAELWVLPNPSGLNAHETVGSLAAAYREAAEAAAVSLVR